MGLSLFPETWEYPINRNDNVKPIICKDLTNY